MIHTLPWILPTFFILVAVTEDLRTKKVRNPIVIGMIVIALAAAIGIDGLKALPWSALGMMTAFFLGFPLFMLGILGAGDVKVFVAASVLLSWDGIIYLGVASLFWGAILGIIRSLVAGEAKALAMNTWGLLRYQRKPEPSQLHFVPFTVALAFAWISYLIQVNPVLWGNL